VPAGLSFHPFLAFSLFHFLRGFASQDFASVIIRDGGIPVAYSCALPKCARFPFMGAEDIQVACCYARPDYRGRGLCGATLQELARRLKHPGRKLWALVQEDNGSSLRMFEKGGYQCVGRGEKIPLPLMGMFGIRRFGTYRLVEPVDPADGWAAETIH